MKNYVNLAVEGDGLYVNHFHGSVVEDAEG